MLKLNNQLQEYVGNLKSYTPDEQRLDKLNNIISFIQSKRGEKDEPVLNFICTHNSRRSQFSQVWAIVASHFYGVPCTVYSGGTEVSSFNTNAIEALIEAGLQFTAIEKSVNTKWNCGFNDQEFEAEPLYSKLYNDENNKKRPFAAIMTCSEADQNCPLIPDAEVRLPLTFNDPKAYDGTNQEHEAYKKSCREIAEQIFYIFKMVSEK